MDHSVSAAATLLAHRIPDDQPTRILLTAMRRMAVGGLDDAVAQAMLLGLFGLGYRRPLVLVRALMAEFARSARRPITVAPACCYRMTGCEAAMLCAVAANDPRAAHGAAERLLGTDDCLGAAITAHALGQAFADLGRPLASWGSGTPG